MRFLLLDALLVVDFSGKAWHSRCLTGEARVKLPSRYQLERFVIANHSSKPQW